MSEILTDEARAAIRAGVVKARDCLREHYLIHRDKQSPDYNECETAECFWCEEAAEGMEAIDTLLADGDALREQVARLTRERTMYHRRAQQAEAALVQAADVGGPSIGRAAANAGYRHWKDRAYAAERERDTEQAARLAAEAKLTEVSRLATERLHALRRQETP